jgi:cellulose synthase/poly-beta-1,6-N-acetylglucosamine synthase-like glycosyltransferase
VLPRVSLVIPVTDDGVRLNQCLESISRNNYPRELIEVIVVHNSGDDYSARVAREHGAIVLRSDGCMAELRDRGAQAAIGGVLAFVDPDDELDDGWIQSTVDRRQLPAGLPSVQS